MAQAITFRAFGAGNPEFSHGLGSGSRHCNLLTYGPTRYRAGVLTSLPAGSDEYEQENAQPCWGQDWAFLCAHRSESSLIHQLQIQDRLQNRAEDAGGAV
jgi:hypothetical protein